MQTMTELQAEADRRSAELTRAAKSKAEERAKIYEEINRRDAEMQSRKEQAIQESKNQARAERSKIEQEEQAVEQENWRRSEKQEDERRYKQAEYAVSFEGQVLSTLQAVAQATQSTADSVRQIRNFIAALLVFGLVAGILLVIALSRV